MTCLHPVRLPTGFVPCGKCVECLKRRQREWFIRLEQECLVASSAFFVTLTYGDEFCFLIVVSLLYLGAIVNCF